MVDPRRPRHPAGRGAGALRTAEDVVFGAELRALADRFPSFRLYEHHTRTGGADRRITMHDLERICPDWTDRPTWACGPAGLLDDVERHWDHAALSRQLHVERFRPPTTSGGTGGRVRFVRSGEGGELVQTCVSAAAGTVELDL